MSGSDFWLPVWQAKRGSVAELSGRSSYTPEQRQLLADEAARLLDIRSSDSLLDVGCAAGFTGEILADRCSFYAGVDYNEQAVTGFKWRCPRKARDVWIGSATELWMFGDGEFKKALMGSVLLCLSMDECRQALSELRRVTSVKALVSGNLERGKASGPQHDRCTWFDRRELVDLALSCGWSRAEAVDIHPDLQPHASFMFDLVVWA